MNKSPDENDLLATGKLPSDPFEDAEPVALVPTSPSEGESTDHLAGTSLGLFISGAERRITARTQGLEMPISTPWEPLNNALSGGLWPGMHVMVGPSGVGRTQFALQQALHAAQLRVPVTYVGLELDRLQLVARLCGLRSELHWSRIYHGDLEPAEHDEVRKLLPTLADLPIHLIEGGPMGWPHETLYPLVQQMRAAYPEKVSDDGGSIPGSAPLLVIVDFLQLVGSNNGRDDLRVKIGNAAYAARAVARDLNAVVLLISSTARENYARLMGQRKGKKNEDSSITDTSPASLIGTGKESGEVEYAADSLMVFARDDLDPTNKAVHLGIAKLRAGIPGWVTLNFDGARFSVPMREAGEEDDLDFSDDGGGDEPF